MTIRIVLADDHRLILDGLESLFRGQPDLAVVARCLDGEAAVTAVLEHRPDLLLLDVRMPSLSGLDVLRVLQRQRATVRTLLLTAAMEDLEIGEAMELGARGVVLKEAAADTLLKAVRCVQAGELWFPRATLSRVAEAATQERSGGRGAAALTPRERDVVRLVCQGLRNKEIGQRLGIGEGTVKIHLHRLYAKLGVESRVALTVHVRNAGLVR